MSDGNRWLCSARDSDDHPLSGLRIIQIFRYEISYSRPVAYDSELHRARKHWYIFINESGYNEIRITQTRNGVEL